MRVLRRLAVTVAASAAFGAAVGLYVGRLQILFAAVKMPLFLLGTFALSFPAMLFIARATPTRDVFDLAFGSVARTAAGLGALSPVVAFFSLTVPIPNHRVYLFLVLLLTGAIAMAGTASLSRLRVPGRVLAAWVLVYGFAGSQVAWLLRPWVGSSYHVRGYFSIHRNLEGNFYEAVFRSVVRLLS